MSKVIYHRHHVVPRHAGGTDDPSNMTCPLTVEEHAEHHRYRYEMLGEWQDRLAWRWLSGLIDRADAIHTLQVESGCKAGKMSKGRKHSIETRQKMKGKTFNVGRKHTIESRLKMSAAHRGKPSNWKNKSHSIESKYKMQIAKLGKPSPRKGKFASDETKRKLSISHIGITPTQQTREKMKQSQLRRWALKKGLHLHL